LAITLQEILTSTRQRDRRKHKKVIQLYKCWCTAGRGW